MLLTQMMDQVAEKETTVSEATELLWAIPRSSGTRRDIWRACGRIEHVSTTVQNYLTPHSE